MSNDQSPVIGKIKRTGGIAGQIEYSVSVTYPDEETFTASFIGSVYGGPVVAIHPGGHETFVTDPGRFGEFGVEWVRRFFA